MHKRLIALLLSAGISMLAQTRDTATIFGTIKDTQGAVIPGATVILTSSQTGQVRQVTSNDAGGYLFNLLPVGSYSLALEQPGFQRYQQTGILLQANENVKVDVELTVGDVKTTVSITAAPNQVETRTATIGETVDQARIHELPLDGRNPADLALLVPGVVPGNDRSNGDADYSPIIRGQKSFSINGSRNNNVRFTLDGGENMDALFNFNLPFPFPDAIQEFSVQTSNMSMDHGNSSAGVVNTVTKSGTNQVHGSGFWFVRNTDLNARSFFSHQQDQLKRNQGGFTLGGPIIKNRLFAFGGLEKLWLRTAAGDLRAETLTAAERKGDFSADGITITDPLTGQPFPNNMIPQARLSQAAQNLLSLTPLPGADGFAQFSYNRPESDWQYIGRVDYVISRTQSLMFRFFGVNQDLPYHSPADNLYLVQLANTNFSKTATLAHSFVVSPSLIAHTQLTGVHLRTKGESDLNKSIADLGVQVYAPSNDINVSLVNSGVNMSTPPRIFFYRATEEFVHDWTWTKGSHTFTWGVQLNWQQYNEDTIYNSSGYYQFDGHVTGFDRADFVLGQLSYFTQNNGELENRRGFNKGFYFGDVWRVTPRLTLSLGLRYEPYGFFTDTKNRNQTFSPENYAQGIKSKIFLNAPPGLLYTGDANPSGGTIGKSVMAPDLNNVAPRVGIAWDPFGDGKTSIRAGYGIYYDAPSLSGQNNGNDVAPFSYQVQFNDGLFDNPYLGRESANVYPVKQFVSTTPFQSPLFTIVEDKKYLSAYTQNWSFTVERQVLPDTRLRVAYVGTKATHLNAEYDENAPIYNPHLTLDQNLADINGRRPLQGYQGILREFYGLNSTYNSLQVSVDKRFSRGFTVLGSYTWSKALDYVSANNYAESNFVQNSFNFFFARSVSDQNRPQRFVTSFVWDLPAPGGEHVAPAVKAFTHNWQFSGILTMMSGRPFSIQANGDVLANALQTAAYMDLIGAGNPVLDTGRSKGARIAEYFDTTRFQQPAGGTYGTLGRNALVGPGFSNMDISLVKGFKLPFLGEAGLGQFRFESFNLFNRTNFDLPDTGVTDPAFGQLINTIGNPRILQIAVKLAF